MADEDSITPETLVADALHRVPGAALLFSRHGCDPIGDCGLVTRVRTLAEARLACGLEDLPALVDELNAALSQAPE